MIATLGRGEPEHATWIAKRPLVAFYILALGLSWVYWLALLGQGQHVEPGSRASHFPGLLGPMISAIVITTVTGGRAGIREFIRRMLPRRAHWRSNLLLSLSPLALGAIAFTMLRVLGEPLPPLVAFTRFGGLPNDWPLALVIFTVLMVNGFGEEAGWRGFLTERLLAGHGRFKSTILVTVLWSIWHLPLFWLNASMVALVGPVLIGWAFGLLCGAFVLAYVYLATGHSIFWVAVWHAAYNMMVAPAAGQGLPAAVVTTLIMFWGVALAIQWWRAPLEKPIRGHV